MDISYDGIRFTPEEIARSAASDAPHVIGLSILSGSHLPLVAELMDRLTALNISVPVVVGGIIPEVDAIQLEAIGVSRIYTPKDFELNRIMFDIVALADSESVLAE
jgi:(2R)-ethylmalonyl-CoA mutase